MCLGLFNEGHGSEMKLFHKERTRETCRRVVVETYCYPMNLSLSTLFPCSRKRKRRKKAKHQAKRVNLCPEHFEIIKAEQAHWIPSISISRSQSLTTDR